MLPLWLCMCYACGPVVWAACCMQCAKRVCGWGGRLCNLCLKRPNMVPFIFLLPIYYNNTPASLYDSCEHQTRPLTLEQSLQLNGIYPELRNSNTIYGQKTKNTEEKRAREGVASITTSGGFKRATEMLREFCGMCTDDRPESLVGGFAPEPYRTLAFIAQKLYKC